MDTTLDASLFSWFWVLALLFVLSAFFSSSETALMTINRYRLASLARQGSVSARMVLDLLKKPDRLVALILLGNNLVNIVIAQLTAYLSYKLYGDFGVAVGTALLTLFLLIFAELTPKTYAILHPQKLGIFSGVIYCFLRYPLSPVVWLVNGVSTLILRLLRIAKPAHSARLDLALNFDELRQAVTASSGVISDVSRDMLVGVLDLEKRTVEDIMIHRNEIFAIDISDSWDNVREKILSSCYTRIPLYDGKIDNMLGVVHLREVIHMIREKQLNLAALVKVAREPYFISECVPLFQMLEIFKLKKRSIALVVNEWGEIQGLVSIEDLLGEIVGEFTSAPSSYDVSILRNRDGSVTVDGSCHIREINRFTGWKLDVSGPKTVNGLILEYLEEIPEAPLCLTLTNYRMEVIKVQRNAIKMVRIAEVS